MWGFMENGRPNIRSTASGIRDVYNARHRRCVRVKMPVRINELSPFVSVVLLRTLASPMLTTALALVHFDHL